MDTSDLQRSSSNPIPSNCGSEKESSAMIQSRREKFFAAYQLQDFILPDSIMFYIPKNPISSELYQKFVQTCKYFFFKNPILVISELTYCRGDKWQLSFKNRPIDLTKITSKFWITDELYVESGNSINEKAVNQNFQCAVLPKLYQCDAKNVSIEEHSISFHDLSLLISFAENIYFNNVTVKDENVENVAVEKIVEVAVKARIIHFWSNTNVFNVTSETMKKLIKLPHFSKLDRFSFSRIPEIFDLETFYIYMKKNKSTKFRLTFHKSISEAYKNRLEEIVDEILATETGGYKCPRINFPGLDFEKLFMLEKFYYSQ